MWSKYSQREAKMTRWQWKREPPGPMTVTPEVL